MLKKIKDATSEELRDDILTILDERPDKKISLLTLAFALKMSGWLKLNDVDFLSAIMKLITDRKIETDDRDLSISTALKLITDEKSYLEKGRIRPTFFTKPGHSIFANTTISSIRIQFCTS